MNILEQNMLDRADELLEMLRTSVDNQNAANLYDNLSELLYFHHLKDSGLSDHAIYRFSEIEKKSNQLIHACNP